jgi:hypothetical protein
MGAADGQVVGTTQIVSHGPPRLRWNLVLLAEGYRRAELAQFAADAGDVAQTLLRTPPFDELAPAINIYRVDVASTDSGAADPTACGGTGAAPRTYFDASFCNSGIRRLLVVNDRTALQVASAQVPQWHMIFVLVNSTTVYGGSGGAVAVFSMYPGATEIALHEMGHTAFHFADEYPCYACTSEEAQQGGHDHHPAAEPAEPNVTINTDRNTIKLHALIHSLTPVPTTRNANCRDVDPQPSPVAPGTIGAFEGAHYYHCGCFRPEYNCRMRELGQPYCGVCRQVIRTTLAPYLPAPMPGILPEGDIATAAYFLWEQAGRLPGRDVEHWRAAIDQLWQQRFGVL